MKRRFAGAFIVALVLTVGCNAGGTGSDSGSGSGKQITFEVTGTGTTKADVTYALGTDQTQENGVTVPWTKTLTSKSDTDIPVVTAQSSDEGGKEIACKVSVGGKVVKENKSTGEFAVVTCTVEKL
jgi:hypothetical protein